MDNGTTIDATVTDDEIQWIKRRTGQEKLNAY
jgi:hypothetical protein